MNKLKIIIKSFVVALVIGAVIGIVSGFLGVFSGLGALIAGYVAGGFLGGKWGGKASKRRDSSLFLAACLLVAATSFLSTQYFILVQAFGGLANPLILVSYFRLFGSAVDLVLFGITLYATFKAATADLSETPQKKETKAISVEKKPALY